MALQNQQTKRSLFFTILIPLLLLILAEVLLFLGILMASGIVDRLNQNDCDNMDTQVGNHAERLENYLVDMRTNLESLADSVDDQAADLVMQGGFDPAALGTSSEDGVNLLRAVVKPMVSSLRACSASGVFVVLNAQDLSASHDTGAYGRKSGVYICDPDPGRASSARNDDLSLECAPPAVAQYADITTSSDWQAAYDFSERTFVEEYDFFYLPFQTAYEAATPGEPMEYACWSVTPFTGPNGGERSLACSVPLILDDGTVFGVMGMDVSMDYLAKLMPYADLLDADDGSYMLARAEEGQLGAPAGSDVWVSPVLTVGFRPIENTEYGQLFSMVRGSGSASAYHTINGQYYISGSPLDIYNANSPFEQQEWALMGIAPQATLHSFSDQAIGMVGMATLLMLLLGFVGSIMIGRSISRPLRGLSSEVAQAELEGSETVRLSSTGIEEVDNLTDAISTLSEKVASARRLEQERIEYERDFDLLTGLMNRRAFYRKGEEMFSSPSALKNAAIVMLDLDNLKTINDAYGHDCGDKYIRQAAQCFQGAVPANVLISRVSGDEFFLLFYGYENRDQIQADIEHLRQAIPNTEFALPDGTVTHINASGGVALYLEDATEFSELMQLADFTMYQVKESGKNNIAYFDFDTYQRKSSALRRQADLDELLDNFEFATYHFQPIFDAHTGKVVAYEALLRVSLGLLQSPADVFELAGHAGRLLEVERLTWRRSLECFGALHDQGKVSSGAYLFINSFADLSLEADELAQIAREHDDVIGGVVIEITEGAEMNVEATDIKRSIPGTSGYFALDDYGSGYSSEVKLLELRPKFVKVDISIIRNIHVSEDKQSLVSQVVAYAHARDMLIVAEGVETAEELDTLLDLGVDLLQGYYLAKPAAEPADISDQAAAQLARARGKGGRP